MSGMQVKLASVSLTWKSKAELTTNDTFLVLQK